MKVNMDQNPYLLSKCPFGKISTKYMLTRHLTWMTSKLSVYMKTFLSLSISLKDGKIFLVS